jgi:hypothetical protein
MLITEGLGESGSEFANDVDDLRAGVLNAKNEVGTIVLPAEADVRLDVGYGANAEELIGELEPLTIIDNDFCITLDESNITWEMTL